MSRNARVIAAAIAVVVLSVWIYHVYQKRSARNAALGAVIEAAERLRKSLPAPGNEGVDFDGDAALVDARVAALRHRDLSDIQPLADAADDYLVTAREILRRQAAIRSASTRLAQSTEALEQHVQNDRGRADWTRMAIVLREAVDRDLRDYRIATESFASIVESLAESHAKIAPYVSATLLDAAAIKSVRQRALDALARTEENVQRITKLR